MGRRKDSLAFANPLIHVCYRKELLSFDLISYRSNDLTPLLSSNSVASIRVSELNPCSEVQRAALVRIEGFILRVLKFLLPFSSMPGCTVTVVRLNGQWNSQIKLMTRPFIHANAALCTFPPLFSVWRFDIGTQHLQLARSRQSSFFKSANVDGQSSHTSNSAGTHHLILNFATDSTLSATRTRSIAQ